MNKSPELTSKDVWLAVVADMEERRSVGLERYGKAVQADDNGENWLQHAYEEALDLAVYLKARIIKEAKL